MNVADAAASGDRLKLLVAMRERIAETVSDPDCPPRDLAALTRRLQDIAKEIAEIQERAEIEGKENGNSGGSRANAGDREDNWDPASI